MKILVTGHKGFIGSHLYKNLKNDFIVDGYEYNNDFPIVEGYDWVVHAGAISSTTESNVELVFRQNYDFTIELIQACNKHKVNLQYSSSASVYGLLNSFSESDPVDPRTPYAWSKYLIDHYTNKFVGDIIIQGFRYFNVYGSNEDHKGSQASPYTQFTKQAIENKVIKVFENSENYLRDFVPVETIVDIHKKFFRVKESGIWNIGTGEVKSFLQVAEEVSKKYVAEIVTIPMPKKLENSYQKFTKADLTKLNKTLEKYNELG